jgi:hypothetical protein
MIGTWPTSNTSLQSISSVSFGKAHSISERLYWHATYRMSRSISPKSLFWVVILSRFVFAVCQISTCGNHNISRPPIGPMFSGFSEHLSRPDEPSDQNAGWWKYWLLSNPGNPAAIRLCPKQFEHLLLKRPCAVPRKRQISGHSEAFRKQHPSYSNRTYL